MTNWQRFVAVAALWMMQTAYGDIGTSTGGRLAAQRDEPDFKAIFADIERDMARQRAELAKRPKDAPLDLATGN